MTEDRGSIPRCGYQMFKETLKIICWYTCTGSTILWEYDTQPKLMCICSCLIVVMPLYVKGPGWLNEVGSWIT